MPVYCIFIAVVSKEAVHVSQEASRYRRFQPLQSVGALLGRLGWKLLERTKTLEAKSVKLGVFGRIRQNSWGSSFGFLVFHCLASDSKTLRRLPDLFVLSLTKKFDKVDEFPELSRLPASQSLYSSWWFGRRIGFWLRNHLIRSHCSFRVLCDQPVDHLFSVTWQRAT